MIRLGFVINNLLVGGAETLLLNFIRDLDKRSYQSYVYTLYKKNLLRSEFMKTGATIREFDLKSDRQFWKILKLSECLARDRIDIVHTHLCDADLYGRIAAKLARIGIIVSTMHSVDPWKFKKNLNARIRSTLDLFTINFCQTIICNSKMVGDFHVKWGAPKEKIRVIYPSAPEVTIKMSMTGLRDKFSIPATDFVVANVARLAPEKGQGVLLQAAFDILKNNNDITFIIVGDGPLRNAFMKLVNDSKFRNKILLLGTRSDVAEILSMSNLFVLPSIYEGFGISIIEAMQQKLPVIASNVGGIPEIIDSDTGLLIPPSNVGELTKAILKLYHNKELCKTLGIQGKQKADEKFNFHGYMSNTVLLYQELTNSILMAREKLN